MQQYACLADGTVLVKSPNAVLCLVTVPSSLPTAISKLPQNGHGISFSLSIGFSFLGLRAAPLVRKRYQWFVNVETATNDNF